MPEQAEARSWLAAEKQVPEALPVEDLDIRGAAERLFGATFKGLVKTLVSEWVGVDGFNLLWQLPPQAAVR